MDNEGIDGFDDFMAKNDDAVKRKLGEIIKRPGAVDSFASVGFDDEYETVVYTNDGGGSATLNEDQEREFRGWLRKMVNAS